MPELLLIVNGELRTKQVNKVIYDACLKSNHHKNGGVYFDQQYLDENSELVEVKDEMPVKEKKSRKKLNENNGGTTKNAGTADPVRGTENETDGVVAEDSDSPE